MKVEFYFMILFVGLFLVQMYACLNYAVRCSKSGRNPDLSDDVSISNFRSFIYYGFGFSLVSYVIGLDSLANILISMAAGLISTIGFSTLCSFVVRRISKKH